MIWLTLLGIIVLGSYFAACYLTGENLLAVWWDEYRLARTPIEKLDAACASNQRDSRIVVTLTTIPSRIGALQPTIKSLLRQTERAREIRVCLPPWCHREQSAYEPPEWLMSLRCVSVVTADDVGPATKFLSTLNTVDENQPVLVVDDDRIYHPRLLETYSRLAADNPDAVITASGWRVPPDLIDRPTTLGARFRGARYVPRRANQLKRPERTDIVQGVHSYLIRPRFFELPELADFSSAPPPVRYVDDVWLSAHCRTEKWIIPMQLGFTDYQPCAYCRRFRRTSLGANVNHAADHARRGNSIALRYFAAHWKCDPTSTLVPGVRP